MKKKLLCFLVLCFGVVFAACSSEEKLTYSQTFFTAFNHLLEAQTLEATGHITYGGLDEDYTLYIDQQQSLEVAAILNEGSITEIAFYIHNMNTYLNFLGTKSQSKASALGLDESTRINIYNPFLDLTDSQRSALFDSIVKSGNTYIFEIDRDTLNQYVDEYGSFSVTKATMTAVIEEDEIKSLSLEIVGDANMDSLSASVDVSFSMDVVSMNQDIAIPFPADLEQYGE